MRAMSEKLSGLPRRVMGAPRNVIARWFMGSRYRICLTYGIPQMLDGSVVFVGIDPAVARGVAGPLLPHDIKVMT